ncbi:MAG: alkaline phosphatase family protein [Candidatus Tumulicola sp.]
MKLSHTFVAGIPLAVVVLALPGCHGTPIGVIPAQSPVTPARAGQAPKTPLQHVIIVIQENRSFDNLFAGYPGADTTMVGKTHDGKSVRLKPITFSKVPLNHFYADGRTDDDHGRMDGFDEVPPNPPFNRYAPYAYVERSLIKPYWDLAQQYVLADHMFPTEMGPSFTAHLNLIAGTTTVAQGESIVDMAMLDGKTENGNCNDPAGTVTNLITSSGQYLKDAGPFPCLSFHTLADALDPSHVSWKYYNAYWPTGGSLWNSFDAIKAVRYGPDWSKVVKVPKQILKDAADGHLAAVSWVIPTMPDSDHPGAGSRLGPSWVASVVNAVGTGPDWKSSAIVVVWDDWGGWYDNAPPPQLDYRGLGLRVPCLIISPYAKKGYVEHTQYEFGSILKTIELIFGLPTIGNTDRRAKGMFDAFDFTQAPRAFQTIPATYSRDYFLHEPPSNLDLDD